MENNKAIIVTGASTGIGKACALRLDKIGFKVFAGIRKTGDGETLKNEASDKMTPVFLDVTQKSSIEAAFDRISNETTENPLFGLVNNAGIAFPGRIEIIPTSDFQTTFEVNVIGLVAVSKAFLPLLRKNKGRIVNIGSISSLIALPGMGSYAASKFAVRAITDSLRSELKQFGLSVSLVAPGMIESELRGKTDKYLEKLSETSDAEILEVYDQQIKAAQKMLENADKSKITPAEEVAKVVVRALTSKRPKNTYLVGKDARMLSIMAKLPRSLLDWIIVKHMN